MYKAIQSLSSENVVTNVKVQFVIYYIDQSMEIPFLKFYLVKDCEEPNQPFAEQSAMDSYLRKHEYLTFPSIDYDAHQHFLFTLYCQGVVESLFHEERDYVAHIQHQGHLLDEENNTAYAFFELTPTTTEAEYMTRDTFLWPVLMDEILHKNQVNDIPIHSLVSTFFVEHPSFLYLSRCKEESATNGSVAEQLVYDMPVVVYFPVPNNWKKTQFTAMFGASRNEEGDFVFCSFLRALDQLLREGATTKHGLVRLALYAGNTTIDKEEFESQADIETFYHGYEYWVKRYEQQKPLSYHHVVNRDNYNILL